MDRLHSLLGLLMLSFLAWLISENRREVRFRTALAGLGLQVGLALIFFILELKVSSYGLLSIAGLVAMLLGSLMLFKGAGQGLQPSLKVILPTVLLVTGFFAAVAALVFKAQVRRPWTGAEGLVGEIGVARTALHPQGKVFVHGELWQATAESPIAPGTPIEVKAVNNLTLVVAPAEDARPASDRRSNRTD